jgi:hypothetical protein
MFNKEEEQRIRNIERLKQSDDAIRSIGGHQHKVPIFNDFTTQDLPDTHT